MQCELCGCSQENCKGTHMERFYELRMYCKFGDGTDSPPLMVCDGCAENIVKVTGMISAAYEAMSRHNDARNN